MPRPLLAAAVAALTAWPGLTAAAAGLSSDRPGFSTSPRTVAPSRLQLEAGYRHSESANGRVETDVLPEANLRYGLVPGLELNLAMDVLVERRTPGRDRSGIGDPEAGFKVGHWQTGAGRFGLLARVTLPAGDAPGTVDDPGVTAGFLWERDLNPYANLFGELRAEVADAFGDAESTLFPAVGIDTLLTGPLSGFLEYYASLPEEGDAGHTVDTGVAVQIGPATQVDLQFGAGLNDEAPDFAGLGIAHRF